MKITPTNNLKLLFPEIAKEWHPTKNDDLKPEQVAKTSNKKVWWLCSKGHEWKTAVHARTGKKTKCPHCGNHYTTRNSK
jgi:hypothetical protein